MRAFLKSTLAASVLFLSGSAAHAGLFGFEKQDGYEPFLNEVTGYNAGQYGTNNGGPGGGPVAITPGTGLWYGISGVRYPAFSSSGTTSYATGHQNLDRLSPGGPAQALEITTNSEGWSGPTLKYGYRLDSRDLLGVSPLATPGTTVTMSFWQCAQIHGTGEGGGLGAGTIGDTVEIVDSLGNVGLKLGLIQPGTTTDHVGYDNGSGFVDAGIVVNNHGYSQWTVTLNLATQKVSVTYFDSLTSITTTLLTAASLAAPMTDFTQLYFASTPGVSNNKLLSYDDFAFKVDGRGNPATPEPSTIAGAFVGLLFAARAIRRRRSA